MASYDNELLDHVEKSLLEVRTRLYNTAFENPHLPLIHPELRYREHLRDVKELFQAELETRTRILTIIRETLKAIKKMEKTSRKIQKSPERKAKKK